MLAVLVMESFYVKMTDKERGRNGENQSESGTRRDETDKVIKEPEETAIYN